MRDFTWWAIGPTLGLGFKIPEQPEGMLGSRPSVGPGAHHVESRKMLPLPQILVHSNDGRS